MPYPYATPAATSDAEVAVLGLRAIKGDTFKRLVQFVQEDKAHDPTYSIPYDLSDRAFHAFVCERGSTSALMILDVIDVDKTNGIIELFGDSSDIDAMKCGTYWWFLQSVGWQYGDTHTHITGAFEVIEPCQMSL